MQYAANNNISEEVIQNLNSEEIQSIPVSICPKLFFEALLLDIRGETIKYASAKKRQNRAEFELCMHKVEEFEQKLHINPQDEAVSEELSAARTRLEEMNKNIAEGAAVRSRARYCIDAVSYTHLTLPTKRIV